MAEVENGQVGHFREVSLCQETTAGIDQVDFCGVAIHLDGALGIKTATEERARPVAFAVHLSHFQLQFYFAVTIVDVNILSGFGSTQQDAHHIFLAVLGISVRLECHDQLILLGECRCGRTQRNGHEHQCP